MILADLIKGNKTATTLPPANANPAKVAKVGPVTAVVEPRLAGLATLALAESKQTDTLKPVIWCQSGDCHCSGMLPQNHYPAECLRIICQHYTP